MTDLSASLDFLASASASTAFSSSQMDAIPVIDKTVFDVAALLDPIPAASPVDVDAELVLDLPPLPTVNDKPFVNRVDKLRQLLDIFVGQHQDNYHFTFGEDGSWTTENGYSLARELDGVKDSVDFIHRLPLDQQSEWIRINVISALQMIANQPLLARLSAAPENQPYINPESEVLSQEPPQPEPLTLSAYIDEKIGATQIMPAAVDGVDPAFVAQPKASVPAPAPAPVEVKTEAMVPVPIPIETKASAEVAPQPEPQPEQKTKRKRKTTTTEDKKGEQDAPKRVKAAQTRSERENGVTRPRKRRSAKKTKEKASKKKPISDRARAQTASRAFQAARAVHAAKEQLLTQIRTAPPLPAPAPVSLPPLAMVPFTVPASSSSSSSSSSSVSVPSTTTKIIQDGSMVTFKTIVNAYMHSKPGRDYFRAFIADTVGKVCPLGSTVDLSPAAVNQQLSSQFPLLVDSLGVIRTALHGVHKQEKGKPSSLFLNPDVPLGDLFRQLLVQVPGNGRRKLITGDKGLVISRRQDWEMHNLLTPWGNRLRLPVDNVEGYDDNTIRLFEILMQETAEQRLCACVFRKDEHPTDAEMATKLAAQQELVRDIDTKWFPTTRCFCRVCAPAASSSSSSSSTSAASSMSAPHPRHPSVNESIVRMALAAFSTQRTYVSLDAIAATAYAVVREGDTEALRTWILAGKIPQSCASTLETDKSLTEMRNRYDKFFPPSGVPEVIDLCTGDDEETDTDPDM